jgi:hypothetical protein
LILSHLHELHKGDTLLTIPDSATETVTAIPLSPTLSPYENAEGTIKNIKKPNPACIYWKRDFSRPYEDQSYTIGAGTGTSDRRYRGTEIPSRQTFYSEKTEKGDFFTRTFLYITGIHHSGRKNGTGE